ncbi:hypothetical protein FRC01_002369 [Tulasnella sp. 417]|nr:hypothetical protein FRC01_002369 [Tulasnella sp. 417]
MAKRAMSSNAKLPLSHSTDPTRHDETASILKFRSFLHAARKHAASTAAASAACASESEDSATNSCTSGTEDTESSDSDDEISDNEAQQLAARARCRRSASPSISTTSATAVHIPPPSPAPQPHIDPEGFWKRREYEWSWTPESPSSTTVKFEIPSIILTPAPSPAEEQDSDVLGYTQAWTPLQSSVCPVTSTSLLTVPECFVLQSDIPMAQPECSACSETTQLRYRKACQGETGMAAEELAALKVEDQRRRGVHGRMWPTYVGTCVCAEWKAYALACKSNEDDLEAQEEEDSPASSPGMPCTPLSTPMELEECGEDKPQGQRWMDFDEDDDELPSLDDWT